MRMPEVRRWTNVMTKLECGMKIQRKHIDGRHNLTSNFSILETIFLLFFFFSFFINHIVVVWLLLSQIEWHTMNSWFGYFHHRKAELFNYFLKRSSTCNCLSLICLAYHQLSLFYFNMISWRLLQRIMFFLSFSNVYDRGL